LSFHEQQQTTTARGLKIVVDHLSPQLLYFVGVSEIRQLFLSCGSFDNSDGLASTAPMRFSYQSMYDDATRCQGVEERRSEWRCQGRRSLAFISTLDTATHSLTLESGNGARNEIFSSFIPQEKGVRVCHARFTESRGGT